MCPVNPEILIEEYSYCLPEERIARYPIAKRDRSNLLVYDRGQITHRPFNELPSILSPDLLIAFNDTRVVQARLHFEKQTGSKIVRTCQLPSGFPETGIMYLEMLDRKCKKMEGGDPGQRI